MAKVSISRRVIIWQSVQPRPDFGSPMGRSADELRPAAVDESDWVSRPEGAVVPPSHFSSAHWKGSSPCVTMACTSPVSPGGGCFGFQIIMVGIAQGSNGLVCSLTVRDSGNAVGQNQRGHRRERESEVNMATLGSTSVDWSDVEDVVWRIVDATQPEKIILFGSAARGELGPDSDLDFLIIKEGAHRRKLTDRIRRALRGVNAAVDLIVATPDDMARYGDSHPLVYKSALKEGLVVYDTS